VDLKTSEQFVSVANLVRPRQRWIVVSLTPSSPASSATGFLLRWM
jgi:hypothetical protein